MSTSRKKKRGPWIDLALMGGILGLLSIILFIILTNDDADLLTTEATSLDDIDSHVTEAESAFPGIRIVSDMSNDNNLPFAIQYPQTDDENFNLFINDYIETSKKSYIKALHAKEARRKNKENKLENELNIYFDTFQYDETYYSFVFTERKSVNNAETETKVSTVFYNTETKKILDIRTLLGRDVESLETFASHIRSLLKSNDTLKDVLIEEQVDLATEARWDLFDQFAIFEEELYIYFDEGKIAPKSQGPITLSVSMSFLNPLLASDFQMNMVEVQAPVAVVDENRKLVALTFDDGPHPEVTIKILDALDKYNAKATFFMLGNRVQYYPEIAKEVLNRGHEIGNHTWSHPVLTKLSAEQVKSEFDTTEQAILSATGQASTIFRPPYGITNDNVNSLIPREVVIWSIDTLDWKHRNADALLQAVHNQMHNHAIILMHDIHHSTADGVVKVLDSLSSQGYEFVTVTEILQYK